MKRTTTEQMGVKKEVKFVNSMANADVFYGNKIDGITMSVASRGQRGSGSHLSNGSGHSGSSPHESDPNQEGELSGDEPDEEGSGNKENNNNNPKQANLIQRANKDKAEAWWTVGEYLEGRGPTLTHQSAKFTLTGNRVFSNQKEDEWDLSDSLAELYETTKRLEAAETLQLTRKNRNQQKVEQVDIHEWLVKDPGHGFVRVYAPDLTSHHNSQLVPVTLSTSAHKVCLMLGISINAIHVQLNGDIIRRLDPYEHPLVLQNEYLAGLGFDDIGRIQEQGAKESLGFLIRFYSGKPIYDSTFSRNQLQAYIDIKKGGVLQNWMRRLCVLSGTRLLIYKDKYKRTKPTVVQLARGSVEEVQFKGHDSVLKLTSTIGGERITFLSFHEKNDYNKWIRKCKKATDKLPTSADLSNCHLEFLPENIFINDQLSMLNLRHNVLKERPIEEDIYTIGWIDDLPRFSKLRSLNLADNNLLSFPSSLCAITTLVELNIASNKLDEIPPEICELKNLQALHVHNNHLSYLPDEMIALRKLFILVLAFNKFTGLPPVVAQMTNVRISEVENIIMAGNQIERISAETLMEMKYVKKVDLRMNNLTLGTNDTMKFSVLEHLTHLDIRDNEVTELDIRALKTLEYLNCERNDMISLQVSGMALKNLFAAHNCIEKFVVNPKPEWLLQIDVSHNCLRRLPEWIADCFFLQKISASHNLLTELPTRLFLDAKKLKSLRVNHNKLVCLPSEVDTLALEECHIHHNLINRLPSEFLMRANKLRVLNATKNRLTSLPPLNANNDLNKIQELYLTSNSLSDTCMQVISGYRRLKVLYLAHNEIHNIFDSDLRHLDVLHEVNISGNELRTLPAAFGQLPKLSTLRAHSNTLQNLPEFKHAKCLRVLDVGHNQLLNVSVTSLMASQISLLDMSLNAQLKVDPRELKKVKNRKSVCLVDLTGQNRALPGLKRSSRVDDGDMDASIPWKVGFSETSGIRNKLCVATLKMLNFGSDDESVFGMFDGGYNNDVPALLLEDIPKILQNEAKHTRTSDRYMKYTMLCAHMRLKASGQRLGASAVLCHIRRTATAQMNHYTVQIANVGDIEAVLCRHGEALVLTRKFLTSDDRDECQRVYRSDGIITEDNKVHGTTKNTRQIGCAYLYPHVIPDPYTTTVALRNDDEYIIVANRGLWKYMSYEEAVEEVYEIGNPVVAAKRLQDLAQGYGSRENIGILVIRLNTERGPSLGRLRMHRSMSIDDVEAAAEHEEKKQAMLEKQKVQRAMEHRPVEIVTRQQQQQQRQGGSGGAEMQQKTVITVESPRDEPAGPNLHTPVPVPAANGFTHNNHEREREQEVKGLIPAPFVATINVDGSPRAPRRASPKTRSPYRSPEQSPAHSAVTSPSPKMKQPAPLPPLKPLPNQRFIKKNAAVEWETILQKRLSANVKDKEMKQLTSSVSSESVMTEAERKVTPVEMDPVDPPVQLPGGGRPAAPLSSAMDISASGTLKNRTITMPPWLQDSSANPAYSYSKVTKDNDILRMTEPSVRRKPKVRGSIANTVAMFEKMGNDGDVERRPQEKHPMVLEGASGSGRAASQDRQLGDTPRKIPAGASARSRSAVGRISSDTDRSSGSSTPSSERSRPRQRLKSAAPGPPSAAASPGASTPTSVHSIQLQNGSVEADLYKRVTKVKQITLELKSESEPPSRPKKVKKDPLEAAAAVTVAGRLDDVSLSDGSSQIVEQTDEDGEIHIIEIARL